MDGEELVKMYYINLDCVTGRCVSMGEQIRRLKLRVTREAAISVDNLDPAMSEWYDVGLRRCEYSWNLKPAEHACLQSHMRTLRMFLESGAPYAIALEDDSDLTDKFLEEIEYLIEEESGWEIRRLQSDSKKCTALLGPREGVPCEQAFPQAVMRFLCLDVCLQRG